MSRTVNDWISTVHGLAVEKGWWGKSPDLSVDSVLAKLMLVVSELSEAVELVREPDFDAKAAWYLVDGDKVRRPFADWKAQGLQVMPKPEGFGVEVADAVIRIFDLMGALELDEDEADADELAELAGNITKLGSADSILAALFRVCGVLSEAGDVVGTYSVRDEGARASIAAAFLGAVHQLTAMSGVLGIDLETQIELKHDYNKSRPIRHGNKRA